MTTTGKMFKTICEALLNKYNYQSFDKLEFDEEFDAESEKFLVDNGYIEVVHMTICRRGRGRYSRYNSWSIKGPKVYGLTEKGWAISHKYLK